MSNNPSAVTVTIWNHSGVTLTKYSGEASKGTAPTAAGLSAPDGQHWQTVSVPDGGSLAVTAGNSNGSSTGDFKFEDANGTVKFKIQYDVPNGGGDATVAFDDDDDYPSSIAIGDKDPGSLDGPSVSIDFGCYNGCAVTEWDSHNTAYTAGYTVPLATNPYSANNARDVVNSLFQSAIRTPDAVTHWYNQGTTTPYSPADYSGGQLAGTTSGLMQTMHGLWPAIGGSTTGPDYPLIDFLADFLVPTDTTKAPLVMYVPKIKYDGYDGSGDTQGPIYELLGYQAYTMAGTNGVRFNTDSVMTFLQLFLAGGHFVNIQADRDFQNLPSARNSANTGRDLLGAFTSTFQDNGTTTGRHDCEGNSHYAYGGIIVNTSGYYYGGQLGEWASDNCGLLLSCLFAKTADSQFNTFMQLEGWPADNSVSTAGSSFYKGGPRHAADFDAYGKSLWNVSTFGACPYSEKRATTIFLAPAPWVPTIYGNTGMMPYVGAETPQDWLRKSLVRVPSGTPSTPSQYG